MKLTSVLHAAILSFATLASAFATERFQAKVTGHGQPVILIPGLSCSGEVWEGTVQHLGDGYECHVLTLAGFAGLPAVAGDFLVPERESIAKYIAEKHLKDPVIIGHSLGGYLATDLAATHPDVVGKVVVVDAYPFFAGVLQPGATAEQAAANANMIKAQMLSGDEAAFRAQQRSGTYTRLMITSEADHERIKDWALASDRTASATAMAEMLGTDLRPKLPAINDPVLVMTSWIAYAPYVDHARCEQNTRAQYEGVKDLRIAVTDTARHFIMLDDPQWFYSQVDSFLAKSH